MVTCIITLLITREWKQALRGSAHPMIFAAYFKLLKTIGLSKIVPLMVCCFLTLDKRTSNDSSRLFCSWRFLYLQVIQKVIWERNCSFFGKMPSFNNVALVPIAILVQFLLRDSNLQQFSRGFLDDSRTLLLAFISFSSIV